MVRAARAWFLSILLMVLACSSTPPQKAGSVDAKSESKSEASVAYAAPTVRDTDPMYEKALIFDRYLSGKLDLEDVRALLDTCNNNPGDNIFCFSVVNYDILEDKLKLRPHSPLLAKTKSTVRPRFRRKNLVNWLDLRFSPVSATLKPVASVNASELMQIKRLALNEKKCPNNAAISVAAALEDWLPDRVGLDEVAVLYEKGSDCLVNNAADRENLLTRAGLFYFTAKEYRKAEKVFAKASSIEDAFVARPLYWLYRSRMEMKLPKTAKVALESMKNRYPFSFHTLVALTAATRDPGEILNRNEPMQLKRSQKEPTLNSLIEQVEVLHRLGFDQTASRVLDWAINDFQEVEPEVRIYLAELKKEQGDYHSKITILSDVLYKNPALISRQTMELYFPKVFFPVFEKHSSESGIDPYLLLAIARRESAFRPKAISAANARGLMQVMPATGRKIDPDSDLMEPGGNISVGSRYVLELLKKVNGQIHFALAAYNAGPHRLSAWTRRYEAAVVDPILFIDLIPYRETREYVASVLRNYYWYRRIHQGDGKMTPEMLTELANIKAKNDLPSQ